jgi:hypothetical protein
MSNSPFSRGAEPGIRDVVTALRPVFNQMLQIRVVRGVRLKDGRELTQRAGRTDEKYVMYDDGVQLEDDNGATFWTWDEIAEVLV